MENPTVKTGRENNLHPSSLKDLLSRLKKVRRKPDGSYTALCPAHEDKNPSLSIDQAGDKILLHCFAGCSTVKILSAVGLTESALFLDAPRNNPHQAKPHQKRIKIPYTYHDAAGNILFQTVRVEPGFDGKDKSFYQQRPDGTGGWINNLQDVTLTLYRLPELLEAVKAGRTIYLTEGEKDADRLYTLGLVATCNPMGAGKWQDYYSDYLAGADCAIIPDDDDPNREHDSDPGRKHAEQVARSIYGKAVRVRVVELPNPKKIKKFDVSDFLNNGGTLETLETIISQAPDYVPAPEAEKKPETALAPENPYTWEEGYLHKRKLTRNGEEYLQPLANFTAKITREVVEDNGQDQTHRYSVEGKTAKTALLEIDISAVSFATLNWLHRWGNACVLEPGQMVKDYVRHYIQLNSGEVEREYRYTHTGWREVNGALVYLTASGGLGGDGVQVELPPELQRYCLPLQPEATEETYRAALSFLGVASPKVVFPLFAGVFLTPLTSILTSSPKFSLYLYGEKSTFKTTLAIAALNFWGEGFDHDNLSNLNDTRNALELRAFSLKDSLMVLDDFHPANRQAEAMNAETTVEKLLRGFANRTGRHRLTAEAKEKGAYWPRGMLLVTGEELISIQSTLTRALVIEVERGQVDIGALTAFQKQKKLIPHAFADYILWLKKNKDRVVNEAPAEMEGMRINAAVMVPGLDAKLPGHIAYLQYAFQVAANWFQERGVLMEEEAVKLRGQAWEIFVDLARKQNNLVNESDPVVKFREVISDLLAQGKVRLESKDGVGGTIGGSSGDLLGWYDDDFFYLLPEPTYHTLSKFCREEGGYFPTTKRNLYRLLEKRGVLEKTGEKSTSTEWVAGKTRRVLKIIRSRMPEFSGQEDEQNEE